MADDLQVTLSHVAICVADRPRAERFYREALGFAFAHEVQIGVPFDVLTELPDLKGNAAMMTNGGMTVELLTFDSPAVTGDAARRAMNQRGLTHLSLVVSDIEEVTRRIDALGGQTLAHTRVDTPFGIMLFATDPDGTRLELWQKPA